MPTISSAGIGSGLDVTSIVDGLMAVERRPLQILQGKQQLYTTQISAYGELISAVSSFQASMENLNSLTALDKFKTSSTNSELIDITSTDSPDQGSFDVEVTRLADFHKMSSNEILSTDTFGGAAGDSFCIQVGSDIADTITVDLSTAQTLADIRDAINADENNPGVRAALVNGDNSLQKLILTAEDIGSVNALTLSYGGAINSTTFGLQTVNDIGGDTAQLDAEFIIDGFTITRPRNTVSDVIAGVTFELNGAQPGTTTRLSITRDTAAAEAQVKSFASAYNQLISSVKSQRSGVLGTDNLLISIESQVKHILNSSATSGSLNTLSDVGLGIDKEGVMSLDADVLKTAVDSKGYADVAQLFAAEGDGFANRLAALTDNWIGSDGFISARTDGLNRRINDLSDRQTSIERNLAIVEARYRQQFSALDVLMSQFQSTGQFLTSQLDQLQSLTLNNSK
ncbi:MAG: flagellar filament capping protein FliD [Gammaproteobacteria bacterium]|nr:flagellar filament capping protein FliD [Gammaproteobacteria bacterium]